ncbi:hypothetical protein MLD38_021237 [Melastoma candidum]|uniref:Uncharacterized protein n=1 Tax=Melastoma candidum TaxID=119954 RepID=A0ACB9QEQ6_9MYRT|nr:hypothetical protein MLD38_021237 [Melastoma candidum]
MKSSVKAIRTDHGTKFEHYDFETFCSKYGEIHTFSTFHSSQNDVAERKNKTLIDITMAMICESRVPQNLWAEAVKTACYISSRVLIRPKFEKAPYELLMGRKTTFPTFIYLEMSAIY